MIRDDRPAPTNPQQGRDENAVRLLRHLFHDVFCPEENVQEGHKGHVTPVYFIGWIDQRMNIMDPAATCETAKVPLETWQFVREVLDSGVAVERFAPIWYVVALSSRPKAKHKLQRIVLNMLLTWEDGTVLPTQIFVDHLMVPGNENFEDALVASLLSQRLQVFTQQVVDDGLDGLHDKGDNYRGNAPEDPFEVMMGLMLKHCIPQVRSELQANVTKYVRLAQSVIRPVIPPEILRGLERQRAQQEAASKPKAKVQGGFDVG